MTYPHYQIHRALKTEGFFCLFDAKTRWSAKSDTNGSEAICNFYLPYLVWIAIWFAIDLSIQQKSITLDSDEYY